VFPIKMWCRSVTDEELGPPGILAAVRHGKASALVLLPPARGLAGNRKTRAAGPVSDGTAALDHEVRDDAMELEAVVVGALDLGAGLRVHKFLGARCQPDEVRHRTRSIRFKELEDDFALAGLDVRLFHGSPRWAWTLPFPALEIEKK